MLTILPRIKSFSSLSVLVLILSIVAGCETAPPATQGGYTTGKSGIQQVDELVRKARSLPSPEKDRLLLQAADRYLSQNKAGRAISTLEKIDDSQLNPSEKLLYAVIAGELALKSQRLALGEPLLSAADYENTLSRQPLQLRIRWHRARGELFTRTGDPSRSIFELSRVSSLLTDPGEIAAVHNKIWSTLGKLSNDQISAGAFQSSDPVVAGWYRLAANARMSKGDITLLIRNFKAWKQQYPDHPAAITPPANLKKLASLAVTKAKKVAVFLPEDGEYKLAAKSLSEGMLAAYYEAMANGSAVPQLTFYDTNSDIVTLYQQALGDGADLIIGPLRREKLSELMAQPSLSVPVLGLNYLEDEPNRHPNLYQFGLSVRDEASQIAGAAWNAGHRSAIAIVPRSRLGESAAEAFNANWQKLGGRMMSTVSYDPSQKDYAQLLAPPLLVSESKARATRLKRLLGKNLDYTPRRRGDIDMVLLVSHPEQGRQIKPALDFLYAADLQVLATSQIYTGTANPTLDNDLDNIIFTAMPWSIKNYSNGMTAPPANLPTGYKNLFAMGVDAYKLHQWLTLLKELPDTEIRGMTGNLVMDGDNQIQRRQPWARFSNGQPVPVTAIPPTGGESRRQ